MSDFHDVDHRLPHPAPTGGENWHDEPAAAPAAPKTNAPFDLARIAEALPQLGAVLWLDRRDRRAAPTRATIGARGVLLLDHPALVSLDHCRQLTAHTAVTPHGPREWLCFRDSDGAAQSKLFLLPDTDYLAWDEMTAASHLAPPSAQAEPWQPHGAFLRSAFARLGAGWRARLLTFDLKKLPWLRTLNAQPPLRISLLGLELARVIARAEGAELVSPLHSA
ncbi:MAG: hypothetical protein ABI843_16285 [Dokdonella sp.]